MTPRAIFPPLEILRKHFRYDPKSGELYWQIGRGAAKTGSIAGCMSPDGYYRVRFGSLFLSHRVIWFIKTGIDPAELEIDHIDCNRGNNKWKNLRLAKPTNNCHNMSLLKRNISGFKGVCWCKMTSSWRAYATLNYKQYRFGYYGTPKEAAEAVRIGRLSLHDKFTNHG